MDNYQVLNIALQTLKQRCEYLQQKLDAVEEENCKLKLEMAHELNNKTEEPSSLEKQIIILKKEKSKMAHQIQMITSENSTLWSNLSKFSSKNSMSSLKFSVSADNEMLNFSQCNNPSDDFGSIGESLEEISLKLIKGIIKGKTELENQYSQMIDLQKENIAEENSSFMRKQIENKPIVQNLKYYIQNLINFRQVLYKQKSELSNAITVIKNSPIYSKQNVNINNKNISESNSASEIGVDINEASSKISVPEDSKQAGNVNDNLGSIEMICPMCAENFEEFQDFYIHVSNHFTDNSDEFFDGNSYLENVQ